MGLPEARAMVRWKRTSWMRYSCGSLRAAYISATSSASSAMCSSVARSAASAATLDSRTRRASNICQGRKPWSAPRTERELESSAGGPDGDEGSGAVAALEDAHGGEETDAGAKTGAADLELAGEFALGRKAVARVDLPAADEGADVLDDLHGELAVAGDLVVWVFDLFFHAQWSSLLPKFEKSNTRGKR